MQLSIPGSKVLLRLALAFVVFPMPSIGTAQTPERAGATGDAAAAASAHEILAWGDWDGDGLEDAFARDSAGRDRILRNNGDGAFEDVSETALSCLECSSVDGLWIDADGDGALDFYALTADGRSRLLLNLNGVLEDVADAAGLLHDAAAVQAHWIDYDGDERMDLHVVTRTGDLLFHNLGALVFERVLFPEVRGLPIGGDGDSVIRGVPAVGVPPQVVDDGSSGRRPAPAGPSRPRSVRSPADVALRDGTPRGPAALDPDQLGAPTMATLSGPVGSLPCAAGIVDANTGDCVQASTRPTLGNLYPISVNLFVGGSGRVGIGTTSPAARLHVAGTGLMKDTLTLDPPGDQALDVATGSIYKDGALFIHTRGGSFPDTNTAVGRQAMESVTTGPFNTAVGGMALSSHTTGYSNTAVGYFALTDNTDGGFNTACGSATLSTNTSGTSNTAIGVGALFYNQDGNSNTASGVSALFENTSGDSNTATGFEALRYNTTGYSNTADGYRALRLNTTGECNTAIGINALANNSTGRENIAIGYVAGAAVSTESYNIAIGNQGVIGESNTIRIGRSGTHTKAFIEGIRGKTTGNANAVPVLIDSAGQLGTVSSSARFKEDIRDMGDASAKLLDLRPVLFRYKQERDLPNGGKVPPEYGLIAEEVAEIFPDLVVYDEEGAPFTVKYHVLSSILLNELKKVHARSGQQERLHARDQEELLVRLEDQDRAHARALEELRARLAMLEGRDAPHAARTDAP